MIDEATYWKALYEALAEAVNHHRACTEETLATEFDTELYIVHNDIAPEPPPSGKEAT